MFICTCVYMYTYMYIHTCCVPMNQPIPSSRSDHFIKLRPNFFYIAKGLTHGSPRVTTFKNIFYLF